MPPALSSLTRLHVVNGRSVQTGGGMFVVVGWAGGEEALLWSSDELRAASYSSRESLPAAEMRPSAIIPRSLWLKISAAVWNVAAVCSVWLAKLA